VIANQSANVTIREDPFGPRSFKVQDVVSDGRHRLILTGELDLAPAAELEAMLLRLCADGTKEIALDLRKLSFMGSTGLRVVLLAKELCEQHGYEFLVIPGPRNIQRMFELTGLLDVLPFQAEDPSVIPPEGRTSSLGP
jgi:stage II sporulation protein AA (anti-sigma F factor antagonist)